MREALAGRFQGLPDVHYGDATHFVDADTGISKWTLTGTTPEGLRLEVKGCDFHTSCDGPVVRKDSCWKIVAWMMRGNRSIPLAQIGTNAFLHPLVVVEPERVKGPWPQSSSSPGRVLG